MASTSALLAGVEIEAPAAVVTSDDSPDARSMSELLADMELRDAAAEFREDGFLPRPELVEFHRKIFPIVYFLNCLFLRSTYLYYHS